FDNDNKIQDGKFKSIQIIDYTYENDVIVFDYKFIGTSDDELQIFSEKKINVPFLKQEFDNLALNYFRFLKSYSKIHKYLALSNNEELLFENPIFLREFIEKNKIAKEIKNELEI